MRDDLAYDDVLEFHETIKDELMRIMEIAFDHPEARTLACPGDPVDRHTKGGG